MYVDPVRCDDSFASFEEVLRNAKMKKVDFVLLAGDLFHDNKPSRRTLHSATVSKYSPCHLWFNGIIVMKYYYRCFSNNTAWVPNLFIYKI